jgi:hypothetical protein
VAGLPHWADSILTTQEIGAAPADEPTVFSEPAKFGQRACASPIGSNRGRTWGVVYLLLGHVLANFNIAVFASASASRRVA